MRKEMVKLQLSQLVPYENNPRINDKAVSKVKESIRQCGYISPIIVDEEYVILAGHTRYKALTESKISEADVIVVYDLSEEQKKKYRLLDNKTNEFAEWDIELLSEELDGLDFDGFDFGFGFDEEEEKEEVEAKLKDDIFQIVIDCEDEEDMESKFNMIQEMGIECRISTL